MLRCITGQQRLDLLKAQWILDEALVVSSPISLLMPVQSVFIELDHHLYMCSGLHMIRHADTESQDPT